jgi:hypothetical protein
MEPTGQVAVWKARTVQYAISILRLMRLMNAEGDVELRRPARKCPECGKDAEVWVVPQGLCGSCWSREAIAAWRVLPLSFAAVRVSEGRGRMRRK